MRNRLDSSQVLMGAEWLNNMPVGDGWFPNQPEQPVVELQCRVGPGLTQNVVEYLYAAIEPEHLRNGTNTNPRVRSWVQTMVGHPKDQAGHIIGKNVGGLGTVNWNIFPQNAHFNMGAYSHYIEPVFYNTAREHGTAKIWFRFVYDDPQEPYRPTSFKIWFRFVYDDPQDLVSFCLPTTLKKWLLHKQRSDQP